MDDASRSQTQWRPSLARTAALAVMLLVGCSTYIGTTAKSFLRAARENGDPNIRYIAYAKLGRPSLYDNPEDEDSAVRLLITKLQEAKEPVAVRAVIVRSLGNLGDRRARKEIIKAVNDVENAVIRVEACRALGKVGQPEDATLLARVMMVDKLEDCRIAAIEGLGLLKASDARIYGVLLDGMENEDPAIRFECLRSLRAITGNDFGVEVAAWRRGLEPLLRELAATAAAPKSRAVPQARAPQRNASPR